MLLKKPSKRCTTWDGVNSGFMRSTGSVCAPVITAASPPHRRILTRGNLPWRLMPLFPRSPRIKLNRRSHRPMKFCGGSTAHSAGNFMTLIYMRVLPISIGPFWKESPPRWISSGSGNPGASAGPSPWPGPTLSAVTRPMPGISG